MRAPSDNRRLSFEPSNPLHAYDFSPDDQMLYERVDGDGIARPMGDCPNRAIGSYESPVSDVHEERVGPRERSVFSWTESGSLTAPTPADGTRLFVQSFPKNDTRIQVSNGGGDLAALAQRREGIVLPRDGWTTDDRGCTPNRVGSRIGHADPTGNHGSDGRGHSHLSLRCQPDGQRILALAPDPREVAPLTILSNWQASLKQ